MQLGFVIDHSRCIGCHACTVACKSENSVPLGNFRTWVKYVEQGAFPEVKRSFAVLRCNQCSSAPCVQICPVRALHKRPDGIVDIDPAACIGCKACMQGCPYDALYINEGSGTAEKCHFCAHRTEIGLAPACAVVCPTEAIVPGDFHDPRSAVSGMRLEHDLTVRKVEAGTGPNVYYRDVAEPAIDPQRTHGAGGYLWAERMPGPGLEAERFEAAMQEAETRATARTTYNVDHGPPWGSKVSAYLFTKSIAAGVFLALALLLSPLAGGETIATSGITAMLVLALVALAVTTVLLVADLRRPERFFYILLRPNWSSWLTRGSVVLAAYGSILMICVVLLPGRLAGPTGAPWLAIGAVLAVLTAAYTGWLFGQSRGRVLWMRRGLWMHLVVQALVAGLAAVLLGQPLLDLPADAARRLAWWMLAALSLHAIFILAEGRLAPREREKEYERTLRLVTRGPFARVHYALGIGLGIVVPALLLGITDAQAAGVAAGAAALVGLYVEEDILVRAGQILPIS